VSTYKSFMGYAMSCTPCPANSGHLLTVSYKKSDCMCKTGYSGDPGTNTPCTSKSTPLMGFLWWDVFLKATGSPVRMLKV
jgi:hypothetical protein